MNTNTLYTVDELSDGWAICLRNSGRIVASGFVTYEEAKQIADSLESDANDFVERW